jgi:hypothetical protein
MSNWSYWSFGVSSYGSSPPSSKDNTRRHVGESLHRSQSQDRLTGTINGGETISESDSTSKLYSDSFECIEKRLQQQEASCFYD